METHPNLGTPHTTLAVTLPFLLPGSLRGSAGESGASGASASAAAGFASTSAAGAAAARAVRVVGVALRDRVSVPLEPSQLLLALFLSLFLRVLWNKSKDEKLVLCRLFSEWHVWSYTDTLNFQLKTKHCDAKQLSLSSERRGQRLTNLFLLPLDELHDVVQQIVHLGLGRVFVHRTQRQSSVGRKELVALYL